MDTPVWELRTDLDLDAVNLHLAALEAAGLLGVAEEGGRATVYLSQRVDDLPITGTWAVAEERDWLEEWKRGLAPVTVGAITVTPPWFPHNGDAVVITPSYAFGTGHHETTAACLAALQELDLAGRSVLDVGTGSAILAIAAARLGAGRAIGVDIDALALESAADNVRANRVEVDLRHGSLDQVEGTFDVVLANLDTDTHKALAPALVAHLARGGTLIASGIANPRAQDAITAFTTAGLPPHAREGHEWTLLVARRP